MLRLVPDGKRKHSTKPMYHLGAVTRVEMQQHLRVGARAEAGAVRLEFGTELRIIVDLAIEYDDEAAVFTGHWLGRTVGEVDDRKPSMPESAMPVRAPPGTRPIWAACTHRVT